MITNPLLPSQKVVMNSVFGRAPSIFTRSHFQVEKQSNPDPYAPVHDFYFLKGPWQDWGRVEFGPDGHFIFNFYLTHQTTTIVNQAQWDAKREYKYLVKLYRDGKMVAAHSLPTQVAVLKKTIFKPTMENGKNPIALSTNTRWPNPVPAISS